MSDETLKSIVFGYCERHTPSSLSVVSAPVSRKHNLESCSRPRITQSKPEDTDVEERRRKQALNGVFGIAQSYQDQSRFALQSGVRNRDAVEKRIHQLQEEERNLSEKLHKLQIEHQDLEDIFKLQRDKTERFQKMENDRKQKEGDPGEIASLIKLVEDKADHLHHLERVLRQHMSIKPLPPDVLEKPMETIKKELENNKLSDCATATVQKVQDVYSRFLTRVPKIHQILVSIQSQLDHEEQVGRTLESTMEQLEKKLESLSRDLERLFAVYKQEGAHSDAFQTTICELEQSLDRCRHRIVKLENDGVVTSASGDTFY